MIKQFIEKNKIGAWNYNDEDEVILVSDLETFMADKVVLPRELIEDILSEWNRQQGLFPQLKNDGWMDLKLNGLRLAIKSHEVE